MTSTVLQQTLLTVFKQLGVRAHSIKLNIPVTRLHLVLAEEFLLHKKNLTKYPNLLDIKICYWTLIFFTGQMGLFYWTQNTGHL